MRPIHVPVLALGVPFAVALTLAPTSTAWAKPKLSCGGQYSGKPYLKCNYQDGLEAIPEICTRYYRNCNGIQVHLSTVCVGPSRGSAEHVVLNAVCQGLAAAAVKEDASLDEGDEHAVPGEVDANLVMASAVTPKLSAVKSFDFPYDGIKGAVPAHRHAQGGGIVANSVTFEDPASVYIGPEALVYGAAVIGKDVTIVGRAQVYGKATVLEGSFVADDAQVFGNAVLAYYAGALGQARVFGDARLECGGVARDEAVLSGEVIVEGYEPGARGDECGGLGMSEEPGVIGGDAVLGDGSVVGAGEEILSCDELEMSVRAKWTP